MRAISRLASVVAGVLATIIGLVSVVGVILFFVKASEIGFEPDGEFFKSIIVSILFFTCGGSLLNGKNGPSKLLAFSFMIVAVILEKYVMELNAFIYAEFALAYIVEDLSVMAKFYDIYPTLLYVILASTCVAALTHILSLGSSKE